jgi:rRNA maturation endonuclease Nob1
MYSKYKCFGCGEIFRCGEISAVCPVCRGKGVKIKEVSEVSEKEAWVRVIAKCERFVERIIGI